MDEPQTLEIRVNLNVEGMDKGSPTWSRERTFVSVT